MPKMADLMADIETKKTVYAYMFVLIHVLILETLLCGDHTLNEPLCL